MFSFFYNSNYSLYTIPLYYIVALYPHAYGVGMVRRSMKRWDYANPRSVEWNTAIEQGMSKEEFAEFERAEAAHKNGMENFPIFASALILGTVVKLSNFSMNVLATSFLGLRILYAIAYIKTSNSKKTFIRSLLWISSLTICMSLFIMSAGKVKNGNY